MKKILALVIALVMALSFVGCGNYKVLDAKYNFTYAQLRMPDGEIVEGKLDSWRDYDDGSDQIQVEIDGVTYLCHQANIVLYD